MFYRAFCIILLAGSITYALAQHSVPQPMGMPGHDESGMGLGISAELSGSVRTFDGKPVQNARVEVTDVMTGEVIGTAYTNQNGSFDITNIANGSYDVRAVSGLDEARERIDLRSSAEVNLHFARPDADTAAGTQQSVSVAAMKVPSKARDAFHKAQSAVTHEKFDEAEKHIAEALAIYPQYSEALALRGVLKLEANNGPGAIDDLDHAVKADPGNAMAYLALGAAFNTMSRYDDAIRTIERGVALTPNSWQAYFEMGKAYVGKGDFEKALAELNKSQELNKKDYAPLHLVRAHALLGMKNYPEAMAELQWYLDKDPGGSEAAEVRHTLDKVRAYAATAPTK
jgi:tetratricopeptide (TPR) repeat protein